jgi:hypothetical protein
MVGLEEGLELIAMVWGEELMWGGQELLELESTVMFVVRK